ncbi:MAG: hypothetical protein N3H30_01630 [Candidatus Micrarchaeota archaeon]|nr:hypothetical protein [Candidatus Micrarchaeota archaeon]
MRIVLVALMVLAVLVLAGCVDVFVRQEVMADGSSHVTNSIDLSHLPAPPTEGQLVDACNSIEKEYAGVDCTTKGLVISLSKNVTPAEGGYAFSSEAQFPYKVYTLTIERVATLGAEKSGLAGDYAGQAEGGFQLTGTEAKSAAQGMGLVGMRVYYTIKMPGEIVEAEGGNIVAGDTVTYDVVKLMREGKGITVKSRELDLLPIAFILLAAAGVAVFFIAKKAGRGRYGARRGL